MIGNIFLSLSIAILASVSYVYYDNISRFLKYNVFTNYDNDLLERGLYTEEKLATFNGWNDDKLYIAILGLVYDVTSNKKPYQKESQYHYFVGRDASRSFVTGNFKDESDNNDHVYDLICEELLRLKDWAHTYKIKYEYKGKAIGRYFDSNGQDTEYKKKVDKRFIWCTQEKEEVHRLGQIYPACNSKWTAETGTIFWCTKNSGGVMRDWVGVPRRYHMPGRSLEVCACLDLTKDYPAAQFKEYENCPPNSVSCEVK